METSLKHYGNLIRIFFLRTEKVPAGCAPSRPAPSVMATGPLGKQALVGNALLGRILAGLYRGKPQNRPSGTSRIDGTTTETQRHGHTDHPRPAECEVAYYALGYLPCRRREAAMLVLRVITEKLRKQQLSLMVQFIDITNAIANVQHTQLLE